MSMPPMRTTCFFLVHFQRTCAGKTLQNYTMIRTAFQTMHPFGQLIFFFCLILMGMGIASGLGLSALAGAFGHTLEQAIAFAGDAKSDEGKVYNLLINGFNQVFSFGIMAWVASKLFAGRTFLAMKWPAVQWILVGFALAWAAQPLIDLTFRLNALLLEWLPSGLLETANRFEALAAEVTASMLTFDASWQFPATLVIVALLPAICEEWAFRGVIQPLAAKWTNNVHAGVWMAAFLFSAIHLQFHGFLPRMILGAGLGYLAVYSGSLWPAIAAHFFNNAGAIMMAAVYGPEWVAEEMNAVSGWELADYGVAAVAVALGIFAVRWVRKSGTWTGQHPVY